MIKRAILFGLLLAFTPAGAQEQGTLSLSPAVKQFRGEAGQSVTQRLTLANHTSIDASFELSVRDVVVRDGTRQTLEAQTIPGGIAASAVFSESVITVKAGESRTVDLTLTIPPDSPQRAVVAMFRGTTLFDHNGTKATGSLGALLTFTLTGDVRLDAAPLRVSPQSDATNATVELDLSNPGSEPLVVSGASVFLDADGRIAGRAQFAPRRLLPGERATIGAEYAGELEPGIYRVVSTLDYEGQALTRSAELAVK